MIAFERQAGFSPSKFGKVTFETIIKVFSGLVLAIRSLKGFPSSFSNSVLVIFTTSPSICGSVLTFPIPGKCFKLVFIPVEVYPLITASAKGTTCSGVFPYER